MQHQQLTSLPVARTALVVSISALILLIPSIINGFFFVFYDSAYYVGSADSLLSTVNNYIVSVKQFGLIHGIDRIESGSMPNIYATPHRPFTYGIFLKGTRLIWNWLPIVLQSFFISYLIWLFAKYLAPAASPWAAILAVSVCTIASPLPYFVGYVMPDVFSGVVPLAVFLIIFLFPKMRCFQIALLVLILVFSISVHGTHWVLAAAIVPIAAMLSGVFRVPVSRYGLILVIASICGSVGFIHLTHSWLGSLKGSPLVSFPYLTARGLEDGPVRMFVESGCDGYQFTICNVGHIPAQNSQKFLWHPETGIYAKYGTNTVAQLGAEDLAVFVAAVRHYPFTQIKASMLNIWIQLKKFGLYDFSPDPPDVLFRTHVIKLLSPREIIEFDNSLAGRREFPFEEISIISNAVVLLSAFILICLAALRGQDSSKRLLIVFVFATVLLNAAICGALSNPQDRYQARIIWLLPALATLFLGSYLRPPSHRQDKRGEQTEGHGARRPRTTGFEGPH